MKPSKLEAYYARTFHEPFEEEERPSRRVSRPVPQRVRERGGIWRFLGRVRLVLMLGPPLFLGVASFVTDCTAGARTGWMPALMRSAACARHDVIGNLAGFQRTMQTVSSGLR